MALRSVCVLLVFSLLAPLPGGGTQLPPKGEQPTGVIKGTVHGRQLSEPVPLANAIVSVTAGPRQYTVTADAQGHYSVPGLANGTWRVQAIHVGFRPMSVTVRVPPSGTVTLDLSLTWEPVRLPTLVIRSDPVRPLSPGTRVPPSELGEVALRALEGTPGMVEGGLAQVVRSIPGNDPSDPRDVLLMRGSATDLKLVLLDGAPVYTPFHMAGLVESFDPEALGGASLFLGGAPARFDGGLSYILELKGRSPGRDRVKGSAAADLLTSRLFLEGPLGSSTGFLIGARALHDWGTPLLGKGPSPYGFRDLLARLEWEGRGGRSAYLTGFWNRESVLLDLPDDAAETLDQAPNFGGGGVFGRTSPSDAARWGNRALAAGFGAELGGTRAELRMALSRYEAELPVGDSLPLFAQSRSDRARLSAEFSRPWGEGVLRFGASYDRVTSDYSAMALDSARAGEVNRAGLGGASTGVYLEGVRSMTASLSIRAGGRLDRFRGDVGVRLAPRLSLTWMLTEQAALTLAAGRYHQYSNVASQDIATNIGPDSSGAAEGGSVPLELTVGSADHLVVSLDQVLTPGLRLGLEGFVKKFSGVSGTRDRVTECFRCGSPGRPGGGAGLGMAGIHAHLVLGFGWAHFLRRLPLLRPASPQRRPDVPRDGTYRPPPPGELRRRTPLHLGSGGQRRSALHALRRIGAPELCR